MIIVFWFSVIFVLYTYVLYPILLWLFVRIKQSNGKYRRGDSKENKIEYHSKSSTDQHLESDLPTVTIIIAVYNGESYLHSKIQSLLSQNYPQDKLSIIFSSDGSNDNTINILESYSEIELIRGQSRQGKATALNRAVVNTDADIIVFTDVRQRLSGDAVLQLVKRLDDAAVGAVSGELLLESSSDNSSHQLGLYWEYEKFIRKHESKLHSVPGVTGALYAIRRIDYPLLNENTLLDDFEVPISIIRKGKRVVFEENAIAYDKVSDSIGVERQRKIRTLMGNYQSFSRNRWLFLPIANPIFWQFISHKFFRLLVPYFLIIILVLPLVIGGLWYQILFFIQLVFYVLALTAQYFKSKSPLLKIINFCRVFLLMQLTVIVALYKYCLGHADSKWEHVH